MNFVVSIFTLAAIVIAFVALIMLVLRQRASLIFGIYPRKGVFYQVKYAIALLLLKRVRQKMSSGENETEFLTRIDQPQKLTDNPQSYDFTSFMAAGVHGEKLLVVMERRRRGLLRACLYIWLPEEGLLCSPKLPDMQYFTTEGGTEPEKDEFNGSGFQIILMECMKRWQLNYDGKLRHVRTGALLNVRLNMEFTAQPNYFNCSQHLSPEMIADAVAREVWNSAFFRMVKHASELLDKRLHYEQHGHLTGELQLNDEGVIRLQMPAYRDHSFGTERCLWCINRYVYMAIFLSDGTNMMVGNLSQPSLFLSSLKVGYVYTAEGVYQPITSSNLELYAYGEKGTPPKHLNFIVETAEEKYCIQITVKDVAERYVGDNWEAKLYNQFADCKVNGVPGYGISEYLYRHKDGRPAEISAQDPAWYQRVSKIERSNEDPFEEIFY